jgi:oligoendopeptidase F
MIHRSDIQEQFNTLLIQDVDSVDSLISWISACDRLDSQLGQDYAWKYIKQTTNTADKIAKKEYKDFLQDIYPQWIIISDKVGRKLVSCEYISQLPSKYHNYIRWSEHAVKYFREENVALMSREKEISSQWAEITGSWTIEYQWNTLTIKQAEEYLKSPDRTVRKDVFELMEQRRYQDNDQLEKIMSDLVQIRTQIANNCGFESYTDYVFSWRYDYTKKQINDFHNAIRVVINPLMQSFFEDRKQSLWLSVLKPYDFEVPLITVSDNEWFSTTDEMIDKLCLLLHTIDPEFETFIKTMQEKNQLDLDSRPNKAPWWYNYPLSWTPYSFIFMNAMRDHDGRFTRAHEAGHGIHHYLTRHLSIEYFRDCPSEICEIASMSMELFTMDDLHTLGLSELQIKDGTYQKLIHDIGFFPYLSKIDLFQQRMYDHPKHTSQERKNERKRLNQIYPYAMRTYDTSVWTDEYEAYLDTYRHRQMHPFEVPFYYIEYGIAQLASLQLYNQFLQDRPNAIENYKKILSAWNIYSIPDTMKLWWVSFDVSEDKLRELMQPMIEKYKQLWL